MPIHTCTGEPPDEITAAGSLPPERKPEAGAAPLTDNFIMALIIIYHFTLVNLS